MALVIRAMCIRSRGVVDLPRVGVSPAVEADTSKSYRTMKKRRENLGSRARFRHHAMDAACRAGAGPGMANDAGEAPVGDCGSTRGAASVTRIVVPTLG